jgi:hypothetical protein
LQDRPLSAWNFVGGPLMRPPQIVVLALAIVLCAASSAQAAGLSIVVGQHNYTPAQVAAHPIQIIPIIVTGTNLVHGSDLSVQLGGTPTAVAPFGTAPPITYQGSEQYNVPTAGGGQPVLGQGAGQAPGNLPVMWDAHINTWTDDTDGLFDNVPTIPGTPGYGTQGKEGTWFLGAVVFNSTLITFGQVNPNNGVEVNLVVNLTGFGPGTWTLALNNTKQGPTDFVDRFANYIPTTITDGSVTITPEPTSLVLGFFAVAGLAAIAIRKHRRCRSA